MATLIESYKSYCPQREEDGLRAAFVSAVASGGFSLLQSSVMDTFPAWAIAGATATMIDGYIVGPALQMLAKGFELKTNGFEIQALRGVSVISLVYGFFLPSISAWFGVAMTVNVLGTLMMTFLANLVNRAQEAESGVSANDQQHRRIFSYWFVPSAPVIWGPLMGLVSTR